MIRSRSTQFKSHNDSVISILKDPSCCRMKTNKSVHFLEPLDIGHDESVKHNQIIVKALKKYVPKAILQANFIKSNLRVNLQYSKRRFQNQDRRFKFENAKKDSIKYNDVKGSVKYNEENCDVLSCSQSFEPKVMNFEFRDKVFYERLNRFIAGDAEDIGQVKGKTNSCEACICKKSTRHSAIKINGLTIEHNAKKTEKNKNIIYNNQTKTIKHTQNKKIPYLGFNFIN